MVKFGTIYFLCSPHGLKFSKLNPLTLNFSKLIFRVMRFNINQDSEYRCLFSEATISPILTSSPLTLNSFFPY